MVEASEALHQALGRMPFVAILRGVKPDEVVDVAEAIMAAGFCLIEVPLNSPDPFTSIQRLADRCPEDVMVGAGTVLTAENAHRLADTGARLMVTPNTNPAVIEAGRKSGLWPVIGCMTPSEAMNAIEYGAQGLKLFPASTLSPAFPKDLRAVLPKPVPLIAVGGVNTSLIKTFHQGGYDGFGIGGSLYKPGMTPAEAGHRAQALADEWLRIKGA